MAERKKRSPGLRTRLPDGFYRGESLYWSGHTMELANFRRVVLLSEEALCVETARGCVTVKGMGLTVSALEPRRLLVQGDFLQVLFSSYGTPKEGK